MKFVAVGDDLRVRFVDESGDESVDVPSRRPLGRRRCVLYEVLAQNTFSILYEVLLRPHGLLESEVRCELRAHRRMSLGRGSGLGEGLAPFGA